MNSIMTIEEKAKAYDEAIDKIADVVEAGTIEQGLAEWLFPELKENEDEKIRKAIILFFELQDDNTTYSFISKKDILAWLEKQGEFKSNKWKEGDVVRYGGVLALVTNGRKAMKSNCEQITIQYPDEWVKAETRERKYFFDLLEKQGEQKPANKKEEIDNLHNYLYSEQKHDNVEPKFKVGDKIIEKDFDECSCGTIIDIKDDKYIFDNGGFIYVKEQSLWKLVEQKTTDKIKPKFHEGDWITDNNSTFQIVRVENEWYHADDGDKICFDVAHQYYHLWTVQDAKDGDVLACKEEILLFKSYSVQNRISLYCWYNGQTNNFHNKEVADASLTTRNKICPATEEQCNLLFQKMKEAGYVWNVNKKELSKIEQANVNWSREDEQNLNAALSYINDALCRWLKDVIHVKYDKSAWSEEDINVINHLLAICAGAKRHRQFAGCSQEDITKYHTWLKLFKDRVQLHLTPEWSEDDENTIHLACEFIRHHSKKGDSISGIDCIELVKRLKSIKPQSTWKPSDEQMRPLEYAIDYFKKKKNDTIYLESLYNDLEKLMEE